MTLKPCCREDEDKCGMLCDRNGEALVEYA
jgi:hypothetical protein